MDAKRDWGYAQEYVDGMHRMLQIDTPETFVLATNRTESVRDFVNMSFKAIGVEIEWKESGEREFGVDRSTGITRVKVNPQFYRPAEVDLLIGDASLAKARLGWTPKTSLEQLCQLMVNADLERAKHGVSF